MLTNENSDTIPKSVLLTSESNLSNNIIILAIEMEKNKRPLEETSYEQYFKNPRLQSNEAHLNYCPSSSSTSLLSLDSSRSGELSLSEIFSSNLQRRCCDCSDRNNSYCSRCGKSKIYHLTD
jgi:hypothetical protein